ncbi:MAG: DUF4296 domain-containing protein [Bacteroidales bacterium]|nr:DUF4296 domain-containing protein [Bacteroidales bacterium]
MKKRLSFAGRFAGILALCCLLAAVGCQKKQEGRVLSQKRLAEVLTDVYLTDAMLNQMDHGTRSRWSRGLSREYFQDVSYRHILDKHHVSEADFYASVAYYSRRNKVMSKICTQVIDRLNAIQAEVDRREELERLAREQRLFDLKWQTVNLSPEDIAPWTDWLLISAVRSERDTALYLAADSAGCCTEDPYWAGMEQALEKVRKVACLNIFQVDSAYLVRRAAQQRTAADQDVQERVLRQREKLSPDRDLTPEEFRADDGGGH